MKPLLPPGLVIAAMALLPAAGVAAMQRWGDRLPAEWLSGTPGRPALMVASALIPALAGWFWVHWTISRRTASLAEASGQFLAGDLDASAAEGGGDFGVIAEAFNGMIAEIREHRAESGSAGASAGIFRSLLERVNDAIEIIDPDSGQFLDMNERGCLDLGYSREEVLQLRLFDINPMFTPESFRQSVEVLRRTGSMSMESVHRRRDGTTFPVEKNISWVRMEREYLVAVVRDLTSRKLEEQARRNLLTERAAIVDAAMDGIIGLNATGIITSFNPAAEQIFDCRSEQVAGHSLAPAIRPAGTLQRLLSALNPHPGTATVPGPHARTEVTGLRLDGSEVPLELSLTRLPGSVPAACMAFVRDITKRREAESRMHAARREAERHLALLSTSLDTMREGVVISDMQGNVYYWNRAALEMHGYASLDECRLHIREFTTYYELADARGEVWPLDQWPLLRVLRGETLQELHVIVRHRLARWERHCSFSGSIARTASGEPLLAVLTISDLSCRLSSETALAEERRRFQNLFESSPVATWLDDYSALARWLTEVRHAGVTCIRSFVLATPGALTHAISLIRVLDLNPAAVRQNAGTSREEVARNLPRLFDESARETFLDQLEALWQGRTSLSFESRSRRLDGKPLHLIINVSIPAGQHGPDFSQVIVTGTEVSLPDPDGLPAVDLSAAPVLRQPGFFRRSGNISHAPPG